MNRDLAELESVLSVFRSDASAGVWVWDSERTPPAARLEDVGDGAIVIEELREEARRGLTDECARRMHRLSRMLERLSKRIDRVVTTPNASSRSGLHGFKPVLGM